ncbi:hypothetical protein AVEN_41844-1 [Araneus ventricosus]|uniref:Uncharacterized protein n=1 Tax=Araneus ventricosus TaxID=182803 RepID=A0A4Y2AET8_ARAVE|nr:hypothetical protein AVEN_41844-1 [Araneus ventricosus]
MIQYRKKKDKRNSVCSLYACRHVPNFGRNPSTGNLSMPAGVQNGQTRRGPLPGLYFSPFIQKLPAAVRSNEIEARVIPQDQFLYTGDEDIRCLRAKTACDSRLHVVVTGKMLLRQKPFQVLGSLGVRSGLQAGWSKNFQRNNCNSCCVHNTARGRALS